MSLFCAKEVLLLSAIIRNAVIFTWLFHICVQAKSQKWSSGVRRAEQRGGQKLCGKGKQGTARGNISKNVLKREWKKMERSTRKNEDATAEHSCICDIATC